VNVADDALERLRDENARLRAALEDALILVESSLTGDGSYFEAQTVVELLRGALSGEDQE